MRAYFREMLDDFAQWRGVDAARVFGGKLVAAGHLTPDDVQLALAQG